MPQLARLNPARPFWWIHPTDTPSQSVSPLSGEPSWFTDAMQAIANLGRLKENWDGYGSPSINQAALVKAIHLLEAVEEIDLPTPEIAPVTGGGIGIAWEIESRELEVEILPDGSAEFLTVEKDDEGRRGTEGVFLPNATLKMRKLTNWLVNG